MKLVGYDVSGSTKLVKFERKLKTGDTKDFDLVRGDTIDCIWAMTKAFSQTVGFHKDGYDTM